MSFESEPLVTTLVFSPDNPCNTTILEDGDIAYTVTTDASGKMPVTRVCDGEGRCVADWVWRELRSDLLMLHGIGWPQGPASAWLKKSLIPFNECVFFAPGWLYGRLNAARHLQQHDVPGRGEEEVRVDEYNAGSGAPGTSTSVCLSHAVSACCAAPLRQLALKHGHGLRLLTQWRTDIRRQLHAHGSKSPPIALFQRSHPDRNSTKTPAHVVPAKLVLDARADEIRDLVVVSFLLIERRRREAEVESANRASALAAPLMTVGVLNGHPS
ncbi:hypothetical protein EVG20_g7342 [Dentipellis fragilis]|uniref:DUF6593 domain-containing protein n=1 Tax=Dentipellis fragilis TaxID=205917 RepID=A0A4Y9YEM3_9AGAM|nr:hypothetical protein EVG20_g7342 [Dentipellis fragilis]